VVSPTFDEIEKDPLKQETAAKTYRSFEETEIQH